MRFLKKFFELLVGYRKWSIMLLLLAIASVFLVTNLISGAEFVDLLEGAVIAFFSANIGEHVIGAFKKKDGGGE